MSVRRVAALELRRARRSRLMQATFSIYVLGLLVFAVGLAVVGEELTAAGALTHVISVIEWLVPAMGLVVGYGAVVTERADRTLHHLVTTPYARSEIVVGKFAARALIVLGAILTGAVVVGIAIWGLFPGFGQLAGPYIGFLLLTSLFGVAMVATGVGISAASRRPVRAATGAMGAFILFVFLWDLLPAGAYYLRHGAFPGSGVPPDWYYFLVRMNPIEAYVEALTGVFGFLGTDLFHGVSLYLTPLAMLVILLGWSIIPLAVGYVVFRRAEL